MSRVRVFFFAGFRDLAGRRQTEIELPSCARVSDLRERLAAEYPALGERIPTALVAVNREYAFDEDPVPEGAEVAVFPPVSGGGLQYPTILEITEADLDLDDLLEKISLQSTGAACIFTGMVRGMTSRGDAHSTIYLEYEAYSSMAEAKLRQIADEIRSRWPSVEGIALVQRIGRMYPRTPTVVVACTASHRDTGVFEAARYGIDRLKEIVPVWKKEVRPEGEEWVEGDHHPGPTD